MSRPPSRRPGPRGKPAPLPRTKRVSTSKREEAEAAALAARIAEMAPSHGTTYSPPGGITPLFTDFPLSKYTQMGLTAHKYTHPTAIQLAAIPHALAGRDVLGAAKTGSGKTLAFVIPVLERLFHARFGRGDGLGALIVTPTRELAMQIFEVLSKVGRPHCGLSLGLIVGGKDFDEEKAVVGQMNILVATPGRLVQHLEQTPDFDLSSVQIVVLDEADRMLDMGFEADMNEIIAALPPARQTLLFSATQTKSVKDLARLSLRDPEYLAVHEQAKHATPKNLTQHYVECTLDNKLNLLYSFIKTHLKSKMIVFVSTCKEAKFLHELFRRIRPGLPVSALHGRIKQTKRMFTYYDFLKKPAAVLFATDIAARGLDFPSVDWVVQLDCPDDPETYIHRVGRTARFSAEGKAMLVVLPSETAMLPLLASAKIPLKRVSINPKHATAATAKVRAEVAADVELKQLAVKAFKSYVKSVALQPNKEVFVPSALPLDAYAEALGLVSTPRVKIARTTRADTATKAKNIPHGLQSLRSSGAGSDSGDSGSDSSGSGSDSDSGSGSESESESGSESDSDEEILTVKATGPPADDDDDLPKGAAAGPSRFERLAKELAAKSGGKAAAADVTAVIQSRAQALSEKMKSSDVRDKARDRERIRERHREERVKERGGGPGVTLAGDNVISESDSGDEEEEEEDASSDESDAESEDEAPVPVRPPAHKASLKHAHTATPASLEDAALELLRKKRRV